MLVQLTLSKYHGTYLSFYLHPHALTCKYSRQHRRLRLYLYVCLVRLCLHQCTRRCQGRWPDPGPCTETPCAHPHGHVFLPQRCTSGSRGEQPSFGQQPAGEPDRKHVHTRRSADHRRGGLGNLGRKTSNEAGVPTRTKSAVCAARHCSCPGRCRCVVVTRSPGASRPRASFGPPPHVRLMLEPPAFDFARGSEQPRPLPSAWPPYII